MNIMTSLTLPLGAFSLDAAFGSDIVHMVLQAGLMVKFVLLVLFTFSVVSWTIILVKWRMLRKARHETAFFLDLFWDNAEMGRVYRECDYLVESPVAYVFRSGYAELQRIRKIDASPRPNTGNPGTQPLMGNVERALKKTILDQTNRLEKALSFLATTGNASPFIGLFGTVWGIMESFRGIGMKGSASLAVVAPGISEALVATAVGLAAAIPAVVAFNYFSHKVMVLRADMETFAADFLSLVERQFLKRQVAAKETAPETKP